jgi:hypothetical protein
LYCDRGLVYLWEAQIQGSQEPDELELIFRCGIVFPTAPEVAGEIFDRLLGRRKTLHFGIDLPTVELLGTCRLFTVAV